ncbi:MAG: FeoB-associated Cys-rich membrane protein [Sphaerochaeta sp.]|jgi:hypothetical protein|nr:FeoB-associated Cys-rich membrane protein [Sphaerochaeta sp.]MCH3919235.1 FeoB-associated Cys-rich membrane protein [Sphaerochaeta sp.]MCI2076254.1 FeoB-associated Cys-rich membrane protein [Sphaerochaeta sp.]MCI2097621.1 FeoB-associated Cys-rich membrane protein [Sphaerochaeta sp.]MCI2104988.1 FeoB-associated Cys-rich membrane protein [Sphaerochaeta sp.]
MTVLANIIVGLVIAFLLFLAIRSVVRQNRSNSCGSCTRCAASSDGKHTCPPSGCAGCPFAGNCHK